MPHARAQPTAGLDPVSMRSPHKFKIFAAWIDPYVPQGSRDR